MSRPGISAGDPLSDLSELPLTLAPADIEAFSTCPFCNTRLEYSNELEDFILAPLVSQWMKAANASVRSRSNLQ